MAKYKISTSDVCFACLAWLYQLFVGTLISLTNVYAGCGRPKLNFIERIDLGRSKGRSVPTAKPLHVVRYVQNVDQFSMNMKLKMFCRLCLILYCLIILCIILCDTSKASENLTFVLKHAISRQENILTSFRLVFRIKETVYIGVFSVDITYGDEDASAVSYMNGFRVF